MRSTEGALNSGPAPEPGISVLANKSGTVYRSRVFDLAFASLAINILSLALPVMTLQVYDRIVAHTGIGTLRILVIGVCAVILLEGALRLARSYVTSWSSAAFDHDTTCRAFRSVMDADFAALRQHGASQHLQQISAIGRLREFIGGQALVSLIDLPFVTIFLGLIWYLAGPLVYVPLVLLGLFGLFAWLIGLRLKTALTERERAGDRRTGFIIEALAGIHTVKSMGLEASFVRRHERFQSDLTTQNYHVAVAGSSAAVLGALFSQIMLVAVTGFGAPMVIDGYLTVGTLVACVMLSGRVMQPLQRSLGIWARLQDVQLAKEQAKAVLSLPPRSPSGSNQEPDRVGQLVLSQVSYRTGENQAPILQDIDLSLAPGQSISISGESGSSKTALLQLITGLLRPTTGKVLVDGADPQCYPADTLADHVGYLSSHGAAYQGTIRDNMTGFGSVTEEKALEIARLIGIDQDIAKLPRGYDTPVSDGAADVIPPGLLQLISIVRVLARKPRILLFDNADRGVDKGGYNRVFHLLGRLKGKAIMVIVSDDRNFLRLAGEEYVLEHGRLARRDYSGDSKVYDVAAYQELQF